MNDPGCGLIFVIVWLVWIGYENYKIWAKPDEQWHRHRGQIARNRSRYRSSILGVFGFDGSGFENHRGRFVRFYRIGFGIMFAFGIVMLMASIAAVMK